LAGEDSGLRDRKRLPLEEIASRSSSLSGSPMIGTLQINVE
jgi:hypothetical protein